MAAAAESRVAQLQQALEVALRNVQEKCRFEAMQKRVPALASSQGLSVRFLGSLHAQLLQQVAERTREEFSDILAKNNVHDMLCRLDQMYLESSAARHARRVAGVADAEALIRALEQPLLAAEEQRLAAELAALDQQNGALTAQLAALESQVAEQARQLAATNDVVAKAALKCETAFSQSTLEQMESWAFNE